MIICTNCGSEKVKKLHLAELDLGQKIKPINPKEPDGYKCEECNKKRLIRK